MKIKVCGLKSPDNIREVLTASPDYIGFIFYEKSKRYAGNDLPPEFARSLTGVEKVGVFVNETEEAILERAKKYGLDLVQLHGDETPDFCKSLKNRGLRIIKAISISGTPTFRSEEKFAPHIDYFLFDAAGEARGGNGIQFDWNLLESYDLPIPFFLAGGIAATDAAAIQKRFAGASVSPWALDLNSRFETSPGLKNVELLKQFKHELFD